MEEITTPIANKHSASLLYFANMRSGAQYQIAFTDYILLQGRLAKDVLNGTHVVKPGTSDEVTIVIRHIEVLEVEEIEPEEYDG